MAASHNDSAILSTDTTFQGRVRASIISAAVAISGEAITRANLQLYLKRQALCAEVLAAPEGFKTLFTNAVSTDANVLSDATQAGTVALTAGNVAAQAVLVTDAHIDAAVAGMWGAFFALP